MSMSTAADAAGVSLAGVKKWYGEVPAVRQGRLNLELRPYAYHWFGRRDGV